MPSFKASHAHIRYLTKIRRRLSMVAVILTLRAYVFVPPMWSTHAGYHRQRLMRDVSMARPARLCQRVDAPYRRDITFVTARRRR